MTKHDASALVAQLGTAFFADLLKSHPFNVGADVLVSLSIVDNLSPSTVLRSAGVSSVATLAQQPAVGLGSVVKTLNSIPRDRPLRTQFVQEIGREALLQMLKRSSVRSVQKAFTLLEDCNQSLADQLRSDLRPFWNDIWVIHSNLLDVAKRFQAFVEENEEAKKKMASQLLERLSKQNLTARIAESSFNGIGRFLAAAGELNPEAGKEIARKVASAVDFGSDWTAEEFTLLCTHVRRLAPEVFPNLIRRALPFLRVETFVTEHGGRQLGRLLSLLYASYDQGREQIVIDSCRFALDRVLDIDPDLLIGAVALPSLNALLHYGELINRDRLAVWIQQTTTENWCRRLTRDDVGNHFALLWNLYRLNSKVASSVARQGTETIAQTVQREANTVGATAFLGLTLLLDPGNGSLQSLVPHSVTIPKFTQQQQHIVTEIVFAAFGLRQRDRQWSDAFLLESADRIGNTIPGATLDSLIGAKTSSSSRELLARVLEKART